MSHVTIMEAAMKAAQGAGTVQAAVRETFTSQGVVDGLKTVCSAVAEFKTEMDTKDVDKKVVNNIINDISRISREVTGLSIVLKSRKGGFVYSARSPKPRATKPKATLTPPASVGPVFGAAEKDLLEKRIRDLEDDLALSITSQLEAERRPVEQPYEVLQQMLDRFGEDKMGEMVIDIIRKDRKTSMEESLTS